jgi:hypothetical protein
LSNERQAPRRTGSPTIPRIPPWEGGRAVERGRRRGGRKLSRAAAPSLLAAASARPLHAGDPEATLVLALHLYRRIPEEKGTTTIMALEATTTQRG